MSDGGWHRQQALYWAKMVDLQAATSYIRRYRDHLGRWLVRIGTVRAVASSASIAGWAVWREYAFVWGLIIACSQVLDAVRDVFPVAKRYKAACEHTNALERLFIDAQLEWENVFAGKYTDDQISKRLHTLRTLHHTAECRNFPDGLPRRSDLFELAQRDTRVFFQATYGVDSGSGGTKDEGRELE